jgi:PAS domain S-box-containing protein
MNRTANCEQIVETEHSLFRLLPEFKDYAAICMDTTGIILSWNRGAKHMYGFDVADVLGRHFSFLYPVESMAPETPETLLLAAEKEGRCERELWKQQKNGSAFCATITVTALYNEAGSLDGFAHATHNITVRKELEEENRFLQERLNEGVRQRTKELETVNKELEAFSYSISHDLRQPLRAIGGYSMMLKEDHEAKLDAEGKRLLDTILANTKMMGELIDDLLAFSRVTALVAVHESVDMGFLVQQCLERIAPPGSCSFVSVGTLPDCKGDNSMLRQVWYNLLHNALKFTSKKEAPQIEIGSVENRNCNIYYVKDNGAGFDSKYAHNLFGVFQRLHRQDEFEGTGLGLALVKRIISKHGGDIWAEASPQQGATFYFSIPKRQ